MIYLISGFSGAGKSHLLKELASIRELRSFNFFDLDAYIEESLGLKTHSLGDYIKTYGLEAFRVEEKKALFYLLQEKPNSIISLGGGTLTAEVLEAIKSYKDIKIVNLATSFEICFDRIRDDSNRPLVLLGKQKLERLYQERRALLGEVFSFFSKDELIPYILDGSLAAKNSK